MASDIDEFIKNQKAKLQQERQQLADDERGERVGRRQWEDPGKETQYAEQGINVLKSPELRLPLSSDSVAPSQQNQTVNNNQRGNLRNSASPRKTTPRIPASPAKKSPKYSPRKNTPRQSRRTPTPEAGINKIGQYEETRKKLLEKRAEEYKIYQQELLPKRTIMVRSYTEPDHRSFQDYDYHQAREELARERRQEYDNYLQTHHRDLIPYISTAAHQTGLDRRFVKRSPSLHHQMFPPISNDKSDYYGHEANDYQQKPEIDYKEWEKSFQREKQKDYNEYLEKQKHKTRKQATPPGSGMKFGEYEEYRKTIDKQRKKDYKQELEKQKQEQLYLKAVRDFNGDPFVQTSPRYDPREREKLDHDINDQIRNQKIREFDKMMAVSKPPDQYQDQRRRDGPSNRRQEQKSLPSPDRTSDPSNYQSTFSYQKHQQLLKEERERETKQYLEQKSEAQTQRTNEPSKEKKDTGLQLGTYEEKRKKLDEERKKEYNEMLAKQAQRGKKSKAAQIREEQEKIRQEQALRQEQAQRQRQQNFEQREYEEPAPRDAGPYALDLSRFNDDTGYTQSRQPAPESTRRLQEEKENEYYDLVNKLHQGREDNSIERRRNYQDPLSEYTEGERRALTMLEEKEREYQQLLKERQERERESNRDKLPQKPSTPGGLFNQLGAHDRERNKLNEERKDEYNKLLNEQAGRLYEVADTYRSLVSDEFDFKHNEALVGLIKGVQSDIVLNTENDRGARRRTVEPREASVPQPEPRQRPATDESPGASLKGLNPRDSAEIRKKQLRNEEYNEYLRQKQGRGRGRQTEGRPPLPSSAKNSRHRYSDDDTQNRRVNSASNQRDGKAKEDIYATLPGLHYNGSAQKRKAEERNREYNEMVQRTGGKRHSRSKTEEPPPPRRGWQSPSYDDILDRKRQEEAQYRREDPSYTGMRAYNSEGAINTLGDDKYKELDREYDTRKVRFRDQRSTILDNDQWLDVDDARRGAEYQNLQQAPPPAAPRGPPPQEGLRGEPSQGEMATSYFATLPVGGTDRGGNERDSAKRRRQDKYREELQLQMQEANAAKRREKVEDLRVAASGLLDPEKTSHRIAYLGNPDVSPRRNVRSPEVKAYHTKFDLSPRDGGGRRPDGGFDQGGGYTPRERGRRRERGGGGLLDNGFDGLLESRPKATYLPPGLEYQPSFADPSDPGRIGIPSTYITGGGGGGLGNPALSSIDEAYHFYGMKNPLEPETSGGGGPPELPLNRLDDPPYSRRISPPRVTFDESARNRSRSRERISPYQFPSDDDFRSKSRQDQRAYQEELERQIQEKRYRDQKAKEEKDRYDRKLEEEIRNYNPFGRGGGGAPIKDGQGNAVTDLRSMHYDNVGDRSARSPPPRESPRFRADPKDDLIKPPPVQQNAKGESTYARGGHGIFGQPRTDAEKTAADRYKDDLRRQIEEKKRQEQIEREKERIEEEKENRRLEEQRNRIQQEYDEEMRKKREKEEDARRKNEELRKQAEDRKKEEDRKRREDADARSREKREQEERERTERQREERGSSPPIPAIRSKMATENGEPSERRSKRAAADQKGNQSHRKSKEYPSTSKSNTQKPRPDDFKLERKKRNSIPNLQGYDHFRTSSVSLEPPTPQYRRSPDASTTSEGGAKSPPVPSHRSKPDQQLAAPQPLTRANSSDVLKELASMRKQLQSERKRVENALESQRNEPDVFDPRMVQRPPPREIDVFERAKQGHAAVPQRQTDTANARNLQDFNELKYKTDTDSRRAFRSMFPDAPTSNSALESQQDALLRHQEDTIKSMRDKNYGQGRQGTMSPKSMLNSNSAFIDAEGINHFPEDFEDLPKRNESARMRRRERIPLSPRPESFGINPMGSTTSLDVDRIQKKNDARLRRLHQMNTDDVSIADPDDILDRFMAKQRYNRPPSGQTLQDDSWLRPGSKAF